MYLVIPCEFTDTTIGVGCVCVVWVHVYVCKPSNKAWPTTDIITRNHLNTNTCSVWDLIYDFNILQWMLELEAHNVHADASVGLDSLCVIAGPTCSSIAKTPADALRRHQCASIGRYRRATRHNFSQEIWQCKHCMYINYCWVYVPNCIGRAYNCMRCKSLVWLCSFGSLVLWISLRSLPDLLHKWNSHVYKQSTMGKLVFAYLWVAGNSGWSEQTTP